MTTVSGLGVALIKVSLISPRLHCIESKSKSELHCIESRCKTGRSSVGNTLPPHEEEQNADAFKSAFEAASEAAARSEVAAAGASQAAVVCEAAYHNPGGKSGGDDTDSHDFQRFVADAQQPLIEGSDDIKLDSMLKLHNWKARFCVSDSVFSDLLSTVGSFLPQDNALPVNAYEAKKTLSNLGLEYIKFHACPNECVIYRGVNETASECPKCQLSSWKVGNDGRERYKILLKVMWYFPVIPRFKQMFKSSSVAELLTWHSNQRIHDGQIRHPADYPSWRNIDYRWPAFGSEPRNLRLALSADEGCTTKEYLKEESVEFCAEFSRNSFTTVGLLKDQGKLFGPLSVATVKSIEEKKRDEEKKTIQWMIGEHNRLFADWFENKVMTELNEKVEGVFETIRWLAGKPSFTVFTFDGYLVDGIRYFTKERDDARVVQNSGVSLVAKTVQVSSAKDLNLVEILHFTGGLKKYENWIITHLNPR
ncbi:hypothetical protein AgCh_034734 [Apium graveolens]